MKIHPIIAVAFLVSNLNGQQAAEGDNGAKNVSVCYETFSLPLEIASKLQRDDPEDSEFYARLVGEVEKESARQESFSMIRCMSGQKASVESLSEQIYPTEYEPAEIPNSVGVSIIPPEVKDTPSPVPDADKLKNAAPVSSFPGITTTATGTAFETRNTGLTLEVEPTVSESGKLVDMRMAPEHVVYAGRGKWGKEGDEVEMPIFETQRLYTAAVIRIGQPFLLGTLNRTPISMLDRDSANRVWFGFVTVTLAKP